MATRPIYQVSENDQKLVSVKLIEFQWFPGMSKSQKLKSIAALHQESNTPIDEVLEISSKSDSDLGVSLSAFNLSFEHKKSNSLISVESAFQGSKVFENGGPFHKMYSLGSREAKQFFKEHSFGGLRCFNFFGQKWPTQPYTVFYDWIYLNTLSKNEELAKQVLNYSTFTDIEFNPKKSINCQAYSAALYVALHQRGLLVKALSSMEDFISIINSRSHWIDDLGYTKYHSLDEKLL